MTSLETLKKMAEMGLYVCLESPFPRGDTKWRCTVSPRFDGYAPSNSYDASTPEEAIHLAWMDDESLAWMDDESLGDD